MDRMLIHDTRLADAHEDEMHEGEPGGDPEDTAAATQAADHQNRGHQRPAHDYEEPMADVGDAQRGEGLDGMGGYGNRPIPQEGGPNQDH